MIYDVLMFCQMCGREYYRPFNFGPADASIFNKGRCPHCGSEQVVNLTFHEAN